LEDLLGVKCTVDDVLIHGTSDADHESNFEGFMHRCQQKGIKLNGETLEYKCQGVALHGHLLTTGLKPDPEKVREITERDA